MMASGADPLRRRLIETEMIPRDPAAAKFLKKDENKNALAENAIGVPFFNLMQKYPNQEDRVIRVFKDVLELGGQQTLSNAIGGSLNSFYTILQKFQSDPSQYPGMSDHLIYDTAIPRDDKNVIVTKKVAIICDALFRTFSKQWDRNLFHLFREIYLQVKWSCFPDHEHKHLRTILVENTLAKFNHPEHNLRTIYKQISPSVFEAFKLAENSYRIPVAQDDCCNIL